jgi:hypothetical protein
LYLDKELVEKSKELGFNLSKTFENQLKHLVNGYSPVSIQNNTNFSEYKSFLVGPPGFEPGSIAPEATSLDQTSRRPLLRRFLVSSYINVGLALNFSGHIPWVMNVLRVNRIMGPFGLHCFFYK